MAIRKKKKKKEEFDASLMGWYLPSTQAPVMSAPVSSSRKLEHSPIFFGRPSTIMPWVPVRIEWTEASPGFWDAWAFYGIGGIADPKNFAEAAGYSKVLGIPYVAGWLLAGGIGFFVTGLAFTFIDPLHKWEGGLDETAFYQRRVTDAVRKPEWGADSDFRKKAEAQYGWGM